MQIRLTVLGPRSGHQPLARASCDVLVTAPAGTALAAVAAGLVSTVGGPDTGGTVILYAGQERLDPQRRVLGEPPLVDGAVVAVHQPVSPDADAADAVAELHVVAGPDAGGVHLLHPGAIRIGRSAEADVPLDDPDVSRLHCAVTVTEDGRVTVADLGSTNGTTLDGARLGPAPAPFAVGSLLRTGESTLRLAPPAHTAPLPLIPDLEGHLTLPDHPGPATAPAEPAGAGGGAGGAFPVGADHPHGPPAYPAAGDPGAYAGGSPGGQAAAYAGGHAAAYAGGPAGPYAGGPAGPYAGGPAGARPDAAGPETPAEAEGSPRPRRGIGAWARRWVGRDEAVEVGVPAEVAAAPAAPVADDAAALLLAALGPTPRLWSRGPGHPEELVVTLGAGSPVALRHTALGVAGPRGRVLGVARSLVAQVTALHAPGDVEVVLVAADRARPLPERVRDWAWLGWLPHTRPGHGQDCRLLLAHDRDQATARVAELTRRLDDSPLGPGWAAAGPEEVQAAAARHTGVRTLVVLDGDPGPGPLRDFTGRLASHGRAAGIHVLCLAEAAPAGPASPVTDSYEQACAALPAFRDCATVALLSGDVATTVRTFPVEAGRPAGHGTTATADAVSAAWAERFARALAPLRAHGTVPGPRPATAALPTASRLLDELGLARATPASLMARWAAATEQGQGVGGLAEVVLGSGLRGPVGVELVSEGPHLLVEGPPGSGRTELLRSVAASLAAAARPDRLGLILLDGAGGDRGEGLQPCTELPHVSAHLVASDPLRMREFAQALGAELKRRAELLDGVAFTDWHARRAVAGHLVSPRPPAPGEFDPAGGPRTGTLRLRASSVRTEPASGPTPLPRLVVLVDDLDALVSPALGSTGRPAAGSVVRALEAVARDGARLGVHLVAGSARPDRTADTELARISPLRVELAAPDQPGPGRAVLRHPDGRMVPFQAGRVTGRIPRTATQRPTVVPLEWERMGDPPARRPVRELGNGPTDLALLASALDRASHLVSAIPVLFPPAP
ncbi:FtsK/SpoIIIE domain-containing protein [Streptomyces sp. WAC06614]|uniref:FtsK/SpoIIIE domain-containing protein n=1 Tax=Streptomyces sp. WAC06614 TaxID=2487416 RepID=UPI000F776E0C|nr:FtsK/SpoIIIE domain-containing protein [Streptomyces sp. WAC06614]RSS79623.1 FHA domain-containing protein [Streptomyces sp. WAC06614]